MERKLYRKFNTSLTALYYYAYLFCNCAPEWTLADDKTDEIKTIIANIDTATKGMMSLSEGLLDKMHPSVRANILIETMFMPE